MRCFAATLLSLWCLPACVAACESIDDDCDTASVLLLQTSFDLGRATVRENGSSVLSENAQDAIEANASSKRQEVASTNVTGLSLAASAEPSHLSGARENASKTSESGKRTGDPMTPMLELLLGSSTEDRTVLLVSPHFSAIMLSLILLLMVSVMGFSILGMSTVANSDLTACALPGDAKLENQEKYFKAPLTELINMLGIPAFSVLDMAGVGLTGLPRRVTIGLLAAQSWLLQTGVLYLLTTGMVTKVHSTPALPRWSIMLASYLNIVNVLGDLPVAFLLLRYLHHFHAKSTRADYLFAYTVCFVGGIVVPCSAVVVGGLWFCTATDYVDLMLKSAVFKFITQIDTWIVAVNSRTNLLAGAVKPLMINMPSDASFAKLLNYTFVVLPVFPASVSFVLANVGLGLRS